MTLVDTHTGELVESLTADEARRLTDRIRLLGGALADTLDKLADLIDQARTGSAWLALGYRSWTEYVSTEFADVLPRLGRDPRQELVRELDARGMSTRAIAPLVGVSKDTVARDLQAPVSNETPEIPQVEEAAPSVGDAPRVAVVEPEPVQAVGAAPAPRPAVTGLDGKQYSRPEPKPKPVMSADEADYDNAAKASLALSRATSKLLEFQYDNMRAAMRRYWSMASIEVPPTPRRDVTPEQMRVAAQGLLTLADEWES